MHRVERMVLVLLLSCIGWAVMGCGGRRSVEVTAHPLELALESGTVEAVCYRAADLPVGAAVLIGMVPDSLLRLWESTARQMAGMGYAVALLPEDGQSISAVTAAEERFRAGLAAVNGECATDSSHTAVVGIGPAAEAAIAVAALNDRIRALALISPSLAGCDSLVRAQLGEMNGRPVVVLETVSDRIQHQAELDRFWQGIAEPKKRVQLETSAVGAAVIDGDLEPVVRRVILLLCDRYVMPASAKR